MRDSDDDLPANSEKKTVYIKTFGCQMNVYDSQRMADALRPEGYTEADSPENADLVLLNTCHIREKAAEKVYSELGRLRPYAQAKAKSGGKMVVGVAGCVAQAEGAEIMRRQPMVDLVVGPQAYHRLPDLTRSALKGAAPVETEFPVEDKFNHIPAPKARGASASFLTVQEGCDKFCAFCVVPYTRGAEVSRPAQRVLDEARALAEQGVCEITLLGQNVNAYHGEAPQGGEWGLARLLYALAEIPGLRRLRYTTSHPNDMDDALIAAHGELDALMPYLHLPVQSGSDRILKAMNRKHDAQSYIRLIERVRAARPDIAISGDFIVGFPGETEQDFEDTLSLVREVRYAQAYSFKYSTRPGTPAADAKEQAPEDVKSERLQRLQELLNAQQLTFQEGCLGMEMPILLEKPGRKPGQLVGRSPYLQAVHVQAPKEMKGRIARVRIEAAKPNSLSGVLLENAE